MNPTRNTKETPDNHLNLAAERNTKLCRPLTAGRSKSLTVARFRRVPALLVAIATCLPLLLAGCNNNDATFKNRAERPTLIVLTRDDPSAVTQNRTGYSGPEYRLAADFAESLNADIQFKFYPDTDTLLAALERGEGDMAAASLLRTEARDQKFVAGPVYGEITQQVVCRSKVKISQPEALVNYRLGVIGQTASESALVQLRNNTPALKWQTISSGADTLLAMVSAGRLDCTVLSSGLATAYSSFHPTLKNRFDLPGAPAEMVWYFPKGGKMVAQAASTWFEELEQSGQLADLLSGGIEQAEALERRELMRAVHTRLPQYQKWFIQAEQQSGVPWTLLAALAWQESHWHPDATSRTGVRGMMMLTQETADRLGVSDRLDPRQSILAGARYLRMIERTLPASLTGDDRLLVALAAYNVGLEHIRDVEQLIDEHGLSAGRWASFEKMLPKLADRRYARKLKNGYARGHEAVLLVQRIARFEEALNLHLAASQKSRIAESTPPASRSASAT